jgi:hypothetical protein
VELSITSLGHIVEASGGEWYVTRLSCMWGGGGHQCEGTRSQPTSQPRASSQMPPRTLKFNLFLVVTITEAETESPSMARLKLPRIMHFICDYAGIDSYTLDAAQRRRIIERNNRMAMDISPLVMFTEV